MKKYKNYTLEEKIEYYKKQIKEIEKEYGNPNDFDKWDGQKQCDFLHTFSDDKYHIAKERLAKLEAKLKEKNDKLKS